MANLAAENRGNNQNNTEAMRRRMAELLNSAQQEAQTELQKERMRLLAANDAMEADFEAANEPMGAEWEAAAEREHGKREITKKSNPVDAKDPDQSGPNIEQTSPFMSSMRTGNGGDDLMKGDIRSSIIPDEEQASKNPPEATPEEQDSFEIRHQEARQQALTTQKMEQTLANSRISKISGQFLKGSMARILKRIPIVSGILAQMSSVEKKGLKFMINLLEKLKKVLSSAKKTAGIGEGVVKYIEIIGVTIETIIIPILLILLFPLYLLFLFFFPEPFSKIARTISQVIKRIDMFLSKLRQMDWEINGKKEAMKRLENIKQQQLNAAVENEPMQSGAQQKAA